MSGSPAAPAPAVPALHALEAETMSALWDMNEASVREVMDALNRSAQRPRAYTTYMTILGRLSAKGLLARRREGKTDFYSPVHSRAEYAELRAAAEVGALIDAYGDIALSHFARHMAGLDPERRDALEQMARAR
jgi:predicted transcriptional regulator